jgi:hypothetical protein
MNISSNNIGVVDNMTKAINEAVKKSIGDAFDKAIEQAVRDANDKRDEVIAATALKLSSWMHMQDKSTQLVITIEKPRSTT